jgi:hypothetical protein
MIHILHNYLFSEIIHFIFCACYSCNCIIIESWHITLTLKVAERAEEKWNKATGAKNDLSEYL